MTAVAPILGRAVWGDKTAGLPDYAGGMIHCGMGQMSWSFAVYAACHRPPPGEQAKRDPS